VLDQSNAHKSKPRDALSGRAVVQRWD
jgi:hypothetical protein